MTSIEQLWNTLRGTGDFGGSRRLDETYRNDFYACLGSDGRVGLAIIIDADPPQPPLFDAVQIISGHRADGRWYVTIWLKNNSLSAIFADLCQTLVEASEGVAPCHLPSFIVSRLLDWQHLLESGSLSILGTNTLRGLVAELIVFKQCLAKWEPPVVAEAWVGPFGAPQDYSLPGMLVEVKAIRPGAPTIHITSVDQLDVISDTDLRLTVVILSPAATDSTDGFSVAELIAELRTRLYAYPKSLADFNERLTTVGYSDHSDYETQRFRLEGVRTYSVRDEFPRLRHSQLSSGIVDARYDISARACEPFETALEF